MNQSPVEINGIIYKLGLNGKVFKLIDGKWITTTTTPAQVLSAMRSRQRRSEGLE